MKTIFTFLLIVFSIYSTAQKSLPYYTGFNTPQEEAGWNQYRLGDTLNSFYQWNLTGTNLIHDYPVGGSQITDDWMVSPALDFSNGALIDSIRFKGEGFGMPFGIDTIAMYLIKGNQNPQLASSITLLELFTDSTYQNNDIWKTYRNYSISAFSDSGYIAFRYKTIVNWLDVSIDDISIIDLPVSIEETNEMDWNVYPNPASGNIILDITDKISGVQVIDLNGKLMTQFDSPSRQLDISDIDNGLYLLRVTSSDQMKLMKIFIKN